MERLYSKGVFKMKRVSFIVLFLSCFFLSCEKEDEFKIPVDVSFQVDMQREQTSGSSIRFTEGHVILSSFEFKGDREQAESVHFEKEYKQGLYTLFSPNQNIGELKFQVPQGNYNRITIGFETFENDDSDDNQGGSGLLVKGMYRSSGGAELPLILELQSSEDFEVVAKSLFDGNQIILKRETPTAATIRLNPFYWFQAVPSSYLENAEVVQRNGVATILISEEVNEDIYEIVVSRFNKGAEVVFAY
ncbi:hypothetical protein H8S84_14180 [Pontibacter sp. SD6]|uniref:Uncharacterized protein n=2 Tax=Pontibacter cellulosilyticus TaxID=1720253 RepID=A0A923NAS2_9BACT|nr:hypothetical protein [Pontibacter cellulosilyticus]